MEDTKFTKILFNHVSLAIATGGFVLGIAFWVMNPQTELEKQIIKLQAQIESNDTVQSELAKIKNNDLHELQLGQERLEERDIEILQALARLEALLNKELKR